MKKERKKKLDATFDVPYDYHDIDDSRSVYLIGEINEDSVKETIEKIVTLSEINSRKYINLFISTYGGSLDETFALYDLMKYITTPIYTIGLGKIMSAGCLLLAAGTKGKRILGKNARLMYHCGIDEPPAGNVFQLKSSLEAFKAQEDLFDKCFSAETGLDIEQVYKLYGKDDVTVDHYLTAQEALKLGIVDRLI